MNAVGLKTYIFFNNGDYHLLGQYIWLIIALVCLFVAIVWSFAEVVYYVYHMIQLLKNKKTLLFRVIKEDEIMEQIESDQRAGLILDTIPEGQAPVEYIRKIEK